MATGLWPAGVCLNYNTSEDQMACTYSIALICRAMVQCYYICAWEIAYLSVIDLQVYPVKRASSFVYTDIITMYGIAVFLYRSRCHGNVCLNAAPKSHNRLQPALRAGDEIRRYVCWWEVPASACKSHRCTRGQFAWWGCTSAGGSPSKSRRHLLVAIAPYAITYAVVW